MELRIFQKGFNFSQDGPGNRLVYHLQGCNLRCPWCSNPEGLALEGGTSVPVEQIYAEVVRSAPMFFEGGGVTLTGGEVTLQMDGVKELFARLHQAGIHTAIETNGISPRLPELFPLLDYLMMDCKHYDPVRHAAVTGVSNESLFRNIRGAVEAKVPLALRIPLIGGFNASQEDGEGFAARLEEWGARTWATVECLPYHEYGKDKYQSLGLTYQMTQQARVAPEQVERIENILRAHGFRVIHS